MILYSEKDDHYSHRVRIVLAEKDIACEIRETSNEEAPDEVLALNPYHCLPILSDRDLGLYDTGVMLEYLDERFPHPQLMPPDPVMRARARLFLKDFESQLFINMSDLESEDAEVSEPARKKVTDILMQISPILGKQAYLLHEEYSMLDVAIAPLLWRLDHYNIKLPSSCAPLLKYADKIFQRPLFEEAMSPSEKAMRT